MRHHQTTNEQKAQLIGLFNEICKDAGLRLDPTGLGGIELPLEGGGMLNVPILAASIPVSQPSADDPQILSGGAIS